MTRDEADACLRILAAVARVDGDMSADEKRALAVFAEETREFGAVGPQNSRPPPIDVAREAERIQSPEARRATFEAALAMTQVDGRSTPEEHGLLVALRDAMKLDDVGDVTVEEGRWRDELRLPLRELADADQAFLKAVQKERDGGELSSERYVAMVEELRREHARVLREALPHLKR